MARKSVRETWKPTLDRLEESTPDSLADIPLRDPSLKYECRIVRKDGKRHPVITQRPKSVPGQFKLDRKNDVLPAIRNMSLQELREAAERYDEDVRSKKS